MTCMEHPLRAHWAALCVAAIAAATVAFPQVYFRVDHADDGVYQGVELLPDNPWSPRVREIMDGHGFGSIYYKDGKDDPYLFQPLGSMTVAYIGKAFGLEINNTLLLSRSLLAGAAFLLIYAFAFLLARDRLVALAGASALLFADAAMSYSGMKQILSGISPSSFLNIGQPANPAMIYIPLFAFLAAFWLFYRKRQYRWGVASAILLGLNFYIYFYSWTYLYAFGGLLAFLFLLRGNWREAVRIGSVFAGALLVAIPYGINLYRASQYATFAEVSVRMGIVQTHAPLFVGLTVLIALGFFLALFPREDAEKRLFWFALLLAPFVTLNQQILTGKEMQAAHYHWYFHKPIAVLFLIVTAFYLLGRFQSGRYRRAFAALLIAGSIAVGAFIQYASYFRGGEDGGAMAISRQRYGPVLSWLNQNAVRDEVVLANDPVSHHVAIYTPLNVAYHRAGYASLSATRERLLDTLFIFYRIRGVGDDAEQVFFKEREFISWNLYGLYYRQLSGSYEAIPDGELRDIASRYRATLATPASKWLKGKLADYSVNYVVWDKKANPDWRVSGYDFLEEAAVYGDIVIYNFKQQP